MAFNEGSSGWGHRGQSRPHLRPWEAGIFWCFVINSVSMGHPGLAVFIWSLSLDFFVLGNNGPCLLHIIIGNFEFEIWNGVFKRDELLKKSIRFSLTKIGWHYVDSYQQIVFNGSNVRANRWLWVNLSDLGWWLARFECDVSRSGFSSARDERLHFQPSADVWCVIVS